MTVFSLWHRSENTCCLLRTKCVERVISEGDTQWEGTQLTSANLVGMPLLL